MRTTKIDQRELIEMMSINHSDMNQDEITHTNRFQGPSTSPNSQLATYTERKKFTKIPNMFQYLKYFLFWKIYWMRTSFLSRGKRAFLSNEMLFVKIKFEIHCRISPFLLSQLITNWLKTCLILGNLPTTPQDLKTVALHRERWEN